MRRCILIGLVLLAGCQNVVGPFRRPSARVDDPRLSISEQEKLGRQFYALPDESPEVAPHSGIARPGTDAGR
ncbi:MAG: hypothetical protein L0Y71_18605 [Gemmataceae bacterium]|nr:hypothetical protein [Gemmataceae bacterium]